MGIKCSLLGHDYGDPEIEREREERGDEVVVTVRETRTCSRCGEETVVSENTEVRPVTPAPEAAEDEAADDGGTDGTAGGVGSTTGVTTEADEFEGESVDDDAVILEDDPEEADPERTPGEWPDADDTRLDEQQAAAAAEVPDEGPVEPDEDGADESETESGADDEAVEDDGGAEIIDAGAETETETETGVEAESATANGSDEGESPLEGTEPEDAVLADEEPTADDGIIDAEETGGEEAAVEEAEVGVGSAGEWPETEAERARTEGTEDAGGHDDPRAADAGSGIMSAESTASPDAVDTSFVCPNCGFSEPARRSSHRAGDICPECAKGYLSEQ